ncbi:MAG: hypothetical protein AB1746_11025 [Candidatus Zixiibacteriota bacterium]
MKYITILSLLLAFVILFSDISNAQPKLTIPEAEFDFGFVPQNSQISHVFWLFSTGTDSLKIVNVRPG